MRDIKFSAECEKVEIHVSKMLKNDNLEKINYIQDDSEHPSNFSTNKRLKNNNISYLYAF